MNNQPKGPTIFLRANTKKAGDRDPDFTGSWVNDGPECWASAWWNTGKDGVPYIRVIKGREKEQRDNQHPAQSAPAGSSKPMSYQHRPHKSISPDPVPTARQVVASYHALQKQPPDAVLLAVEQGHGDEPWFEDIPF